MSRSEVLSAQRGPCGGGQVGAQGHGEGEAGRGAGGERDGEGGRVDVRLGDGGGGGEGLGLSDLHRVCIEREMSVRRPHLLHGDDPGPLAQIVPPAGGLLGLHHHLAPPELSSLQVWHVL